MKKIIILIFAIIVLITPLNAIKAEDAVDPAAELKAASDYFKNLGIKTFNCDIKVIFDPSNQYKMKDIEQWNIQKGTYVFIGHYNYADGGIFSLEIFGETVARNDAETADMQSTIVVPLLPMPGSIMSSESIGKRYKASYRGDVVIDDYECYKIRLDSNETQDEFFEFLEYCIDKKDKVIRRADCAFDLGIWVGHGYGEFYYTKKKGILMPNVGYGNITFRSPWTKQLYLWGKWSGYKTTKFDAKEEESSEEETKKEDK